MNNLKGVSTEREIRHFSDLLLDVLWGANMSLSLPMILITGHLDIFLLKNITFYFKALLPLLGGVKMFTSNL